MEGIKELEIKYGELDIYYPLKLESSFSFEESLELISERMGRFFSASIERGLNEEEKSSLYVLFLIQKYKGDIMEEKNQQKM